MHGKIIVGEKELRKLVLFSCLLLYTKYRKIKQRWTQARKREHRQDLVLPLTNPKGLPSDRKVLESLSTIPEPTSEVDNSNPSAI